MSAFRFVDLFCGGGGSITGAINALKNANVKYEGRGFNHWEMAKKQIGNAVPPVLAEALYRAVLEAS